jgi:hypothetical protein
MFGDKKQMYYIMKKVISFINKYFILFHSNWDMSYRKLNIQLKSSSGAA